MEGKMRKTDRPRIYDFEWLEIPLWVLIVGSIIIYVYGMSEG